MKEELIRCVKEKVLLRIQEAQKAIDAAQSAANEETKSSAGDKYETGRAMAQNDRDMYARQLLEAEKDFQILEQIATTGKRFQVGAGSLVETTIGALFIAISSGIIELNGKKIMVLSPESPLGQAVSGKNKEDVINFRDKKIKILEIS
jgi:hypothetical protein